MPAQGTAAASCPNCGNAEALNDDVPLEVLDWPWHLRGHGEVKDYIQSLGAEAREWLLALYVDKELDLLAVEVVGRGDVTSCPVNMGRIFSQGFRLKAAGFILVHNHPSGDPTPSRSDIRVTNRLREVSLDLEMPLLDHLIVAGDEIVSVGEV